jgi:Rieske Fe-S protein
VLATLAAAWVAEGRRRGGTLLADVQAASDSEGGLLRLKLSDFPALQEDFGSVRIGTSPIRSDQTPAGLFHPVIITRGAQNQFYALDAACTHEGCTVPIYNPSAGCIECPCHGSQYLIDGSVRRGPAGFPLRQFEIRFDGRETLQIEVPDISFALTAMQVQPRGRRLKLEFIAFEEIVYEVHFRPALASEWSGPTPFALTLDGPLSEKSLRGAAHIATVYLEAPASEGFYAVALRTAEV